jgi:hypothetical protein
MRIRWMMVSALVATCTMPAYSQMQDAPTEQVISETVIQLLNGNSLHIRGEQILITNAVDGTQKPALDGQHIAEDGVIFTVKGGRLIKPKRD